jgi:hypothetical protein
MCPRLEKKGQELRSSPTQSGKKIPKWMPRARVGIYVRKSLRHARSVSLVLNPSTGLVSPQYHCKYDDTFETVRGIREETHGTWREKCGLTKATKSKLPITTPLVTQQETKATIVPTTDNTNEELMNEYQVEGADFGPTIQDVQESMENEGVLPGTVLPPPVPIIHGTRRSGRTWKPTTKYLEGKEQEAINLTASARIAEYDSQYKTFIEDIHPVTVLAPTDGDTMYWDQAIKQHNAKEFIQAALDEISTHQDNQHW